VVVAGAAVTMEQWRHDVPAILMTWYSGMEGGAALADVLLGVAEPGGRLPCVIPRDESDLPAFERDATTVTYDAWHGQRLLDRDGKQAAYPLGFGLSYTDFAISAGHAWVHDEVLETTTQVQNAGDRGGSHVLQLYAVQPIEGHPGVDRRLIDFARVALGPGETREVRFRTPTHVSGNARSTRSLGRGTGYLHHRGCFPRRGWGCRDTYVRIA
jgi:beta-glucosidase